MNLLNKNLYEIVTNHPELADFLYAKQVIRPDDQMINTIGKKITLAIALQSKKINPQIFMRELAENVPSVSADVTLKNQGEEAKDIKVKGVLPCPVRIPMLEKVEEFKQNNDCSDVSIELQAASMGVGWLKDSIKNAKTADDIADLYLSAGFELFFDRDLIGKFRNQNIFEDFTEIDKYNADFENESLSLRDPKGMYSILGVVPAIFVVNKNELNGRPIPTSWAEILTEEWENNVSLSIGDFDLFNAVLLNIYKMFGKDGIKKLARSFHKSMHPSEMVLSHRKAVRPAVSIMPLFFSKMAKEPMTIVWPQEGAIISPIFMLSKKDKKEQLKPLVDLFAGSDIAKIMSYQGRFPSTHPDINNFIQPKDKFIWIGWDLIENEDIHDLIIECMRVFEENCGLSS